MKRGKFLLNDETLPYLLVDYSMKLLVLVAFGGNGKDNSDATVFHYNVHPVSFHKHDSVLIYNGLLLMSDLLNISQHSSLISCELDGVVCETKS